MCPGGRPTGDELTVLLVTLPDVLAERLEGESALGGWDAAVPTGVGTRDRRARVQLGGWPR